MNCPVCTAGEARVLETRDSGDRVLRRRECGCGARWTTEERLRRGSLTPTNRALAGPQLPLLAGVQTTTNTATPTGSGSGISGSDPDLGSPDPDSSKQFRGIPNSMNPVTTALRIFCAAWKAQYGVSYIPSPRECGQLRAAAARLPLDELPAILDRYLADTSPFVAQDMRHSLAFFLTGGLWNKYRVRAPVRSKREAASDEAVQQFVNGGNHARPGR